ncbi:hypothetical protein QBC41DRAFT_231948 [Cercophora samala]|uniref:RRM domain-containing protein n=1 Tax=Cercophora samala TaxID=330535 RepID=A0AA40D9R0_9PEZI|nr:hypothetical protein QBC41DRAFT_231948 [Cercophora samala]
MIPAHVGFDHIAAQNHSSIHSNIGPVPAGTGAHGQLSHGNHQTSHTNGAVPAQGNHMGHNLGVNTPHRGYQVGQSNHVANPNSNSGPPHGGNNLAHSNSAGVLGQNNITAPTPTNGGKKVDYWFNALTGEKRNPDGSLWTPHGDKEDVLANHSVHNQTEPRNFAPRPMGTPYMFPPPPNFNMVTESNSQIGDIVSSQAMADPFISPHSSAINAVNQVAFSQAGSFELLTFSEPSEGEVELAREWGLLRHKLPTLRGMGTNELRNLIRGCLGVPDESVLLSIENFPFTESSRQFKPATYGVIKISNIPFGTTRAEIIAMLGRNSKIISDAQEPVHIIMERVTSKTGDAFVEFTSVHAAARTIERHNEAVRKHRHPRLGDRPIEMTMSSQTELMEALFPWCRGVRFYQGRVDMLPFDKENPWNVFRGFVTEEEMNLVIKHVEVPSRSPYSKDCPQRPYESMISTLKKIPWDRSDIITLEQRQILFDTTFRLIESLWEVIHKGEGTSEKRRHENVLNEQLYKRLVNAAMLCPGFSVLQKDNIAYLANLAGPSLAQFNMPPFSECWTHLYNLCPRPQFPVDVLEFYIALIREETVRHVSTLPEPEQASIKERAQDDSLYFGYMWHEIGLPQGKELADMTLDQVAQKELDAIQRILRRAAANARNPRVADTSYQHQDHSSVI